MGQYKVPQNVESEDKILGPLSIKQFIYVVIALMWAFLMWRLFFAISPLITVVAALPVSGLFLALGIIQREEQSFENYFIAMVRFIIVPRQRVWQKEDGSNVTKVLAPPPKKAEPAQRNPAEVRGQLEKLALIVDTRGQINKGEDIQLTDENNQAADLARRIQVSDLVTKEVLEARVSPHDDILDMQQSQKAQTVGELLVNVEADIRNQALAKMQQALVRQGPPADSPESSNPPAQAQPATTATTALPMQPTASPSPSRSSNDILKTVMQNGDITITQIANQANRTNALADGQTGQPR